MPAASTEIDWRAALVLFQRHGWTIGEIAKHYGVHYRKAWGELHALGARRPKSPAWHTVVGQRLYNTWRSMRRRCLSLTSARYRHYGARGNGICAEWDTFPPFHKWATKAGYQLGDGLALIEADGDFGPKNCRWLNRKEREASRQARMPPRKSKCMVKAFGESKTIEAWARDPRCHISAVSLTRRLRLGTTVEAAITTPPRTRWDDPLKHARRPALVAPQPTVVDWDRVVRMHRERGLSASEIAAALKLSYTTIWGGLRKRGAFEPAVGAMTPTRHRLYGLWESLWKRTTDPKVVLYKSCGAQGVRVCAEWRNFEPFFEWAIATGAKPGLCIARIRRLGPYSPANCVWSTRAELVAKANRRNNRHRGRSPRRAVRRQPATR
jgi:hypothetical protein